ncbi:MAG: ABC transporter permease [Planctomycetes bacterium]|nr:ABC transporter permease [Planctomycetota bacterium]
MTGAATIIECGATRSLRNPRELWNYRELLALLAWRDFRVRYRQTALGATWAILEPLATACVLTLLFHAIARLEAGYPYTLFCCAGALPWTFCARVLRGTSVSLTANAGLLGKAYFPRLLLPASSAAVAFVDLGFALLAYLPLALYFGLPPGWAALSLPLWILLGAACAGGIGAGLAVINVRFRDVSHAMPLLLQLWMLLTPVAYPLASVPDRWRWLMVLNPLTGVVEGMRWALLPDYPLSPAVVVSAVVGALVALAGGLLLFHAGERELADIA